MQYAVALDQEVSLGVVSYSGRAGWSHRDRTRLMSVLGPHPIFWLRRSPNRDMLWLNIVWWARLKRCVLRRATYGLPHSRKLRAALCSLFDRHPAGRA